MEVDYNVTFKTGNEVSASTQQQFIIVESNVGWSATVTYLSPESHTDWITLSPESGSGNANVVMTFGKNTLDQARRADIIFYFAGHTQTLHFLQHPEGHQVGGESLGGWLELPSFEADNNRYYFSKHMLPSTGNAKRSFSLLYDSDIYHSLWVAYPLYADVLGSGNRTNAWGIFDPNIPTSKQLNMERSYSGYDRGHILPSASRAKSTSDNRQTFYPTNMSPQLAGLNQQKWAGIEGQVRNWANSCDTLYVVTGAVFQTVGGNESVKYTYCRSDSSKDVAVPNYYYKALLQRRGTGNNSSYTAVAIWVPHKAASGLATKEDLISIDELEQKTGIDFFHNLDDSIEESVESQYNPLYWNL